ncbi:MAG: hypothetical protein R2712_13805 [Vicinamibacterales bacterium]
MRLAIRDEVPASSWQTWRGWAWAAAGVCAAALVGGVLVEPRPDAWPAVTPIVSAAFPLVASAVAVGAAAPADPNRRRRPAEPPVPASRGDDHPVRTAAVFDPREREAFLALLAAGPLAAAAPAVLARAAGDTGEDDGMPPVNIAPLDTAPLEVSGPMQEPASDQPATVRRLACHLAGERPRTVTETAGRARAGTRTGACPRTEGAVQARRRCAEDPHRGGGGDCPLPGRDADQPAAAHARRDGQRGERGAVEHGHRRPGAHHHDDAGLAPKDGADAPEPRTVQTTSYRSVGTAITCIATGGADGVFEVSLNVDDSSIFTTHRAGGDAGARARHHAGVPFVPVPERAVAEGRRPPRAYPRRGLVSGEVARVDGRLRLVK